MVLVTVLCVWLGLVSERARKQREAVEAIEKVGGAVRYEYQSKSGQEPPGPKWLRELVGEEYFVSVIYVGLNGSFASRETLIDGAGFRSKDMRCPPIVTKI